MEIKEKLDEIRKDGVRGEGKKLFVVLTMGLFGIGLALYAFVKSLGGGKKPSSGD